MRAPERHQHEIERRHRASSLHCAAQTRTFVYVTRGHHLQWGFFVIAPTLPPALTKVVFRVLHG
jgi:hypothetical protein